MPPLSDVKSITLYRLESTHGFKPNDINKEWNLEIVTKQGSAIITMEYSDESLDTVREAIFDVLGIQEKEREADASDITDGWEPSDAQEEGSTWLED